MEMGEAESISVALLVTDLVDSTRLAEELGDARSSAWWRAHDRCARDLIVEHHGREIDKSDGFLLLFERVQDAVAFAEAYHGALRTLEPPVLSRVGIHVGPAVLRRNESADIALGAKAVDIDGTGKAIAARIMALAQGGQTLLSANAAQAAGEPALRSHGHWRLKGLDQALELFEHIDASHPVLPPQHNAASYRIHRRDGDWQPVHEQRHTLPAERDAFVGRGQDLHRLASRFAQRHRLVSLLGAGGSGKTRLALRYGHAWRGDFEGGVWWCDLSAAQTLEGVLHAVARGLDLPPNQGDPVEQIGSAMRSRGRALVVLDNFEQVAEHAEETTGLWLSRAPELRLLVTSRQQLSVAGEACLLLDPLPPPDGIELFHRRAEAVRGHALPDDGDTQMAVARLVAMLDGLPLAIELAAARTGVLTLAELSNRLANRFSLLRKPGAARGRQATLEATLDWSWDLLDEAERSALAQLSVFRGGWSLAAAEAVVDLGDDPPVLDALDALRAKSLIRIDDLGRFGMLTCVADYASGQLEQLGNQQDAEKSSRAEAELRHARYFAKLNEELATVHQCADADNLVESCRRAIRDSLAELATAALQASWFALLRRGPYSVAAQLGADVLQLPTLTAQDRAATVTIIGHAYHALGRKDDARIWLDRAVRSCKDLGLVFQARAHCLLGDHLAVSGQRESAEEQLLLAQSLMKNEPRQTLHCRIENALGALCSDANLLHRAEVHFRSGLVVARALRHARWQCGLIGNLAMLDQLAGLAQQALLGHQAALELAISCGERRWQANSRCNLGLLLNELGRTEDAERELTQALSIANELGQPWLKAATLCNLGLVYMKMSEPAQAIQLFNAAQLERANAGIAPDPSWRDYIDQAIAALHKAPS